MVVVLVLVVVVVALVVVVVVVVVVGHFTRRDRKFLFCDCRKQIRKITEKYRAR